MPVYTIKMTWDKDAAVWYAVCDDIPIALESGSFDALVERVKIATPELLDLNGKSTECILNFKANRKDEVALWQTMGSPSDGKRHNEAKRNQAQILIAFHAC